MNRVIFPLKPRMRGQKVADLQIALRFLLAQSSILPNDPKGRRTLSAALFRELATGTYGDATRRAVSLFQRERELKIIGAVDEATASELNQILEELTAHDDDEGPLTVHGTVRTHTGALVVGELVAAFDRDLRSEQALGQARTDRRGDYRIEYSRRQFSRAEKDTADLVVKVVGSDGAVLVSSPILFNALPVAKVDVTLPEGVLEPASLFERIAGILPPLLAGVRIEALEEDTDHQDLMFLSGETGFERSILARFTLAHRLVAKGLPAEFWFVLLGESFYQFTEGQGLREQLQGILDRLSSFDANAVRKTITRGLNQKEIAEKFRSQTTVWIEAFLQFMARRTVRGGGDHTVVKRALQDAQITNTAQQETFARLFNQHKAFTPELLKALDEDASFSKRQIDDLHTTFALQDLTQADFTVVALLKREFNVRQPDKIRSLAKTSEDDWVRLVKTKHAAGDITLPTPEQPTPDRPVIDIAEIYGTTLARQFRDAFPTTAFVGGLERTMSNGRTKGLTRAELVHDFLDRHDTFELLTTPIDEFLKNSTNPDDQPLAGDEEFRREVKAVQRVFKLAPTFEATDALLADRLHSAQTIYRMGRSEFVQRYAGRDGFTRESATLAWNRAAETHAAILTLIADLKGLEAETLPAVLKHNDTALSEFPNWNSLFRTGDVCECEHCRSVLSPAAYFADLLLFLRDRDSGTGHGTAKDVLFHRRPDLGFLELNCPNALTTLPYVDVVCEVLEAAVDATGENDLQLTGLVAIPADAIAARAAVSQAFSAALAENNGVNDNKQKIALRGDFTLSQVDPAEPNEWVVHDSDVTYRLKKKGASPNFFAEILRNTKTSAQELRAYPQYVNPLAYDRLRNARFPLTLPFDLFAEEVRAGFQKSNLQRWDLMRTLHGTTPPNNASDGHIAAEYFGISVDPDATFDERRLILVTAATIAGQQAVWGETGGDWLNRVSNVKTFLQKTSLEYNDLLVLLDLPFINPNSDIVIHHLDASCDLDQKVIQSLNPQRLDRIHRFLRLWRKLKTWKMWELDLAIRQIGNGLLNEAFLINLFYFSRLRNRLGPKATVEQGLALFNDLNTETRFTELHEKREDALYQNLFLNRRLFNPVDSAFLLDPNSGQIPGGQTITDPIHLPVVLAALGLSETDLRLLLDLTRASDGSRYIADPPELTVGNLSFLWRHSWLATQLKFKTDEWPIALQIFELDLLEFSDPRAAWEFVESVGHLKATGFSPDELSWLLAANRSAKAAVKESDAARFLAALRKELQNIQDEFNPDDEQRYPVLREPPTDVEGLRTLLSTVLQKLNRDENETSSFLNTLKGHVVLEAPVQGLPGDFVFPATVTAAPNHVPIEYDPELGMLRMIGVMSEGQRTVLLGNSVPLAVTENGSYSAAINELFQQSQTIADEFVLSEVEVELVGGVALPDERPALPIRYNSTSQRLSFIGVMTDDERQALIAAGNPADAIDELFRLPRLAVKFFAPIFTAPLDILPPSVDFKAQLSSDLAAKVSYDSEERLLRFVGIMSAAEQTALNNLVAAAQPAEVAYHTAVDSLAIQPQTITHPDSRVWVMDEHLDESNGTLASRMALVARAGLNYLSMTLTANTVVQRSSAQLDLSEALTRRVLEGFAIMPPIAPDPLNASLMMHLTRSFAATDLTVDYAALKSTFDGWFWANRVATILNKWKVSLGDLEALMNLSVAAQLLDVASLPMDDAGLIPPMDRVLRTSRLLRIRDSVPETHITFLEVLEKLNDGVYATAAENDPTVTEQGLFATDVERMNEAWKAPQVEALIALLDITFPDNYLLAESWERLRRAFYFLESLNAGAQIAASFATSTMEPEQAKSLKELLRSKFGEETWLTLSAEIQDVLRERKRDALAAYLLTRPLPDDAPSGKWENTNDLYAYYLLDVEMSACQLTSRLVQGSGSVQLFVQRCFMGLESDVRVEVDGADGDSAWRWWEWMRKYRVWEANRKVFLWPENWIEPELKKDRSPFFKDLENELLQNDINQYSVETAYTNYLEKLDGVAQLEVAGFYQEDDGDNTIIHVFGRTKGAEPHLYYYRRYDYRQWSPWEKVDLDIQGDYLIPAVINKRLFLFWPVFTEVPDQQENSTVTIPSAPSEDQGEKSFTPDKTIKRLKLQMAVSDYRQGKWRPKQVSVEFGESNTYDDEIIKKHYHFVAVDETETNGRFAVKFGGHSTVNQRNLSQPNLATAVFPSSPASGAFEMDGCRGGAELTSHGKEFIHVSWPGFESVGNTPVFHKWVELSFRFGGEQDFALTPHVGWSILQKTPGIFAMSPPWQLSYFDRLILDGQAAAFPRRAFTIGTWLPFFYNDRRRTFFVLPAHRIRPTTHGRSPDEPSRAYYPEIKTVTRQMEAIVANQVRNDVNGAISSLSDTQRAEWEEFLSLQFGDLIPPVGEKSPSYTDEQFADYATRWLMRFYHLLLGNLALWFFQFRTYHFKNFYHPFVCEFAKLVYNPIKGIPALMNRETQLKDTGFRFKQFYDPTPLVVNPGTEEFYPKEDVDFTPDGAYSSYNWELFFHAPLLIANSLSKNQRFKEARDWYHYIFNPIGIDSPMPGGSPMSRYWITKPFFLTTQSDYIQQRIDNILRMLAGDTSIEGETSLDELIAQVKDWRTNPFEPHRIANYRTVAYQKTVAMKYLDNLIAWGDSLFRQDSMESINEATQLYILAAEILGERPKKVPPQARPSVETFNELAPQLDAFGNALMDVENLVPVLPGNDMDGADEAPLPMLYFCIPQNDKLLGYWDTVADRLFKIRHCMNIEGVVRQLALFEPPIDPGALVKAVAGGMDLSSALADLNAPLPLYRFTVMLQKANEVCNDVKALGGGLLSALEKKDAEALSLLRQGQEMQVLEAVTAVREEQVNEANENIEVMNKNRELAEAKKKYYESREFMNTGEIVALSLNTASTVIDVGIAVGYTLAGGLKLIPDFLVGASGFGGTPHATVETGGKSFGSSAEDLVRTLESIARALDKAASLSSTVASYQRRKDDWDHQGDLAVKEIDQIDKSIAAAQVRKTIAEKERDNHLLQIENSKAVDEFMRSKYTNEELYQWQIGQISGVYFQSYQLAYDLAKRAERCFRFELGLQDSSFIQFGYWDSLKKGLLSGEKLQYDLRRLELAYLEQNRRELELTKHVSLLSLDPLALVKLRETGRCFVNLPEEIFDLDFPGHYFRRIKSVSLTVPCVTGPYTTLACTLRLLKNSIRINTVDGDNGYARNTDDQGLPADDTRFIESTIPVKAVATSNAQNDSGIFELSFRDERYLPFEGAGVITQWSVELFNDLPSNNPDPGSPDFGKPLRQFDYSTISDVVLHIKYTAREDAGPFKNGAITHLREYFVEDGSTHSLRMFNFRHEFPNQWHSFLNPTNPSDGNVLTFEMSPHLFRVQDRGKTLTITGLSLLARCADPGSYDVVMTPPLPAPPPAGSDELTLTPLAQYGGLHVGSKGGSLNPLAIEIVFGEEWQLRMTRPAGGNLETGEVTELFLVLSYAWE